VVRTPRPHLHILYHADIYQVRREAKPTYIYALSPYMAKPNYATSHNRYNTMYKPKLYLDMKDYTKTLLIDRYMNARNIRPSTFETFVPPHCFPHPTHLISAQLNSTQSSSQHKSVKKNAQHDQKEIFKPMNPSL
jgi:hypothetical protein